MSPASGFHDPAIKPVRFWPCTNQGFYARFRRWLRAGGYGESALSTYGVAARLALGWLDKEYALIDPDADLERVRDYIRSHYDSPGTRQSYFKGLAKLAEFLRHCQGRRPPVKPIDWDRYLGPLPGWLADDVRTYLAHRSRSWLPEERIRLTNDLLGRVTRFLGWAAAAGRMNTMADLTPELWFDYLDARLAAGIGPITLNTELGNLQSFLQFLTDQERPVGRRLLRVERLKEGPRLPKDAPLDQLRQILQQIEVDATGDHDGLRRMGLMDRAWFHLMLHSGLRSGEVRRLQLADLNLAEKRVRIEQSKGLKDRIVPLSQPTVAALQAYLEVRGPADSDHLFLYRHRPLSPTYCNQRLRTYGRRCGVQVRCHQLRHSCATLLLNAGAPILTVQAILGHKHIDTTLAYARLYDGTVAADYYRAMGEVERRLALGEGCDQPAFGAGRLLALVDALHDDGTLNEVQRERAQALREGILAWGEEVTRALDKAGLIC